MKFLAYYQGVADQNLNFSIDGSRRLQRGSAFRRGHFPCNSSGDVETEGSGGAGIFKIAWQAAEFQLYTHVGTGDYSIKVPSTTAGNTISGDKLGLIFGAGLKASIVPERSSTRRSRWISASRDRITISIASPRGTPGINNGFSSRLELMTYQVAIETSHLFTIDENWKLEPYGGVKWTRVQADLKDLAGGGHAGGQKDTGTPFWAYAFPPRIVSPSSGRLRFSTGFITAAGWSCVLGGNNNMKNGKLILFCVLALQIAAAYRAIPSCATTLADRDTTGGRGITHAHPAAAFSKEIEATRSTGGRPAPVNFGVMSAGGGREN